MADDDFKPPQPAPGKRYVFFKPPRSRTLHANIVMQDGYQEDFDTHSPDVQQATIKATQRVRALYGERNIVSPGKQRRAEAQAQAQAQAQADPGAPLPPGPLPILAHDGSIDRRFKHQRDPDAAGAPAQDGDWNGAMRQYDARSIMALRRIQEILILNAGGDDPRVQLDHVRAVVIQELRGKR